MPRTKAPQSSDITSSARSPVERYFGLIKAMAGIMAVLIVTALTIIVVTIYGRLTATNVARNTQENKLMIPVDSRVTSASLAEKGQMLLIIEGKTGQHLWQIDPAGKIRRKTRVIQSP